MRDFTDKVAVVTGAGSGIGKGSAIALAREGCHIVVADINDTRAEEAVAEIRSLGVEAVSVHCDVGSDASVAHLQERAISQFGRVHIVMNNAGTLPIGRFEDVSIATWERTLNINLLSVVRVTQAFLPLLMAGGEGHLVNTASLAGLYAYEPNSLAYNASKAAVISLSEGLALYLREQGIGVTCLCPGPVATNIREQIQLHGDNSTVGTSAAAAFSMRTPAEVGELVVDAIREGRFLLPTNAEVFEILKSRGCK